MHPNICTGTATTFPQESHSAAALRHCWDTDSSLYGVHNKELFSLGMIKYKETPHGEGLRFMESALAVLTDEARSPPDVSSWSASPPRSCFSCHSQGLATVMISVIWLRPLGFDLGCASPCPVPREQKFRREGCEQGTLHAPRHPCHIPACAQINMGCMFLAEKSQPVCLCFHIPTQKARIRNPGSLPREQGKVFVYVCDNQKHRITNVCFNVVLREGGRWQEEVTRGKSG